MRDTVLFAAHSVLKDPPFMRLDLISCHNLLTYLERQLQHQVCILFRYGLKPHRFLFLGSAETVDAAPDSFVAINSEARLYQARPFARRSLLILEDLPIEHRPPVPEIHDNRDRSGRRRFADEDRSMATAHLAALERERFLPYQLDAEVENVVEPMGLRWRIELPLSDQITLAQ